MQISLGLSLCSMYVCAEAGAVKLTILYSGSVICIKNEKFHMYTNIDPFLFDGRLKPRNQIHCN